VIVFDLGVSGQRLILESPVIEHLEAHRQLTLHHREAGGQLFATFSEDSIVIKEATGPRQSDHRTRTSYRPDRRAEQQRLAHTPVATSGTVRPRLPQYSVFSSTVHASAQWIRPDRRRNPPRSGRTSRFRERRESSVHVKRVPRRASTCGSQRQRLAKGTRAGAARSPSARAP
jgi:hypothetical protein